MRKRRGASGRRPGFRLGVSGARNLALVSIFLGLALLDLCARSGIIVLSNKRPSSGVGPDSAEAGLDGGDRDGGDDGAAEISGGGGDEDERKFDALVNSDLGDQTEPESGASDGWGAFEQDEDSNKMALAPLNTLLDDADPLLECCPILRVSGRPAKLPLLLPQPPLSHWPPAPSRSDAPSSPPMATLPTMTPTRSTTRCAPASPFWRRWMR